MIRINRHPVTRDATIIRSKQRVDCGGLLYRLQRCEGELNSHHRGRLVFSKGHHNMAATAQNHMEPLHGDEKKHDEYEYEDECTYLVTTCDPIT